MEAKMNNMLQEIVKYFQELPQVRAVVLGGSRQNSFYDKNSDFDIYVYSTSPVAIELRLKLAKKYSTKYEVGNSFWEDGDEWVMEDAPNIDIMYRNCDFPEGNIDWVFEKCNASVGFSTCILYNIYHSKILFDKDNWFEKLQKKLQKTYPDELTKAIILKNYPILSNNVSSYNVQIKKAFERGDFVNLNNRITAFLSSYFDILFAINKVFHPGEKRLVQMAEKTCKILPANFRKNIKNLLSEQDTVIKNIQIINEELDKILKKYKFL